MPNFFKFRLFLVVAVSLLLVSGLPTSKVLNAQGNGSDRINIDVSGKPADVIKELRREKLVPAKGGKIGFQYKSSFVEAQSDNYNILRLGRGISFKDLVLNFDVRPATLEGETSGCGMVFGASEDGYTEVMLTNDRRMIIRQFTSDSEEAVFEFTDSLDELDGLDASDYKFNSRSLHTVTIVAIEDSLTAFLDGIEIITTDETTTNLGPFGVFLFNEEGTRNLNECRFGNIWIYSFD